MPNRPASPGGCSSPPGRSTKNPKNYVGKHALLGGQFMPPGGSSSGIHNLHRKGKSRLVALKARQAVSEKFPETSRIRYNSTKLITTIHAIYENTINTIKLEFSSPNMDSLLKSWNLSRPCAPQRFQHLYPFQACSHSLLASLNGPKHILLTALTLGSLKTLYFFLNESLNSTLMVLNGQKRNCHKNVFNCHSRLITGCFSIPLGYPLVSQCFWPFTFMPKRILAKRNLFCIGQDSNTQPFNLQSKCTTNSCFMIIPINLGLYYHSS